MSEVLDLSNVGKASKDAVSSASVEKNPFHQRRATNSDDETAAVERRQELANMKNLVKTQGTDKGVDKSNSLNRVSVLSVSTIRLFSTSNCAQSVQSRSSLRNLIVLITRSSFEF